MNKKCSSSSVGEPGSDPQHLTQEIIQLIQSECEHKRLLFFIFQFIPTFSQQSFLSCWAEEEDDLSLHYGVLSRFSEGFGGKWAVNFFRFSLKQKRVKADGVSGDTDPFFLCSVWMFASLRTCRDSLKMGGGINE